jgi:hypothetical protein
MTTNDPDKDSKDTSNEMGKTIQEVKDKQAGRKKT